MFAFLRNGQQVVVSKDTVTPANSTPLPVELMGATGEVAINAANLNIEVRTSAYGANPDSVRVSDGTDELAINPDGSINFVMIQANPGVLKSSYGEITSVAAGVLTTIQSYTAPLVGTTYLQLVSVSGTNVAEYRVLRQASIADKKRTYFGGNLNADLMFAGGTGIPLDPGDTVTVRVIHSRPDVGDFNSRIQVIEV